MSFRSRVLTAAGGGIAGAAFTALVMHMPFWVVVAAGAMGAVMAACLAVILWLLRCAIVRDGGMYD